MRIVSFAGVVGAVVVLASPAFGQAPAAVPICQPACGAGFVCSPTGQCVSACNPACAANEVCTADAQCIPAPLAVPAEPATPPSTTSPWATPANPPPSQVPATPTPVPVQPGWGAAVGPATPAMGSAQSGAPDRRETGRRAIQPRGLLGVGVSVAKNDLGSGLTDHALLFPILLRAPMGSLQLELQLDHVLGVLSPEFGDSQVAYSFGNPYLGLYGSFGDGAFFIESGLGISLPAAQTEGEGGYRPATLAAAMIGLWDFYRFIAVGGDDFVGIVPHARGDLVLDGLVAAVEIDLPFLIPIGDTRDYYDLYFSTSFEAILQIAVEGGFQFLGSSVVGARLQQVIFLSEGWSERYQAALEPFFRLAPRGHGYLRVGALINLGQMVNASDVVAFSLTTGTIF